MRILAFDIGGTAIKIGVVENDKVVEEKEIETKAKEGGEALICRIIEEAKKFKKIDRIGISTAGQVDIKDGSIIFASENLPGWTGMKVKERLEKALNIKTAVENDVNCAALGEAYFGAGRGFSDFLALTYGTGIGGAIVSNKKIYHGSTGSAGEFGHMITHGGGYKCNCGGRGCYERYASTSALVRMALNLENVVEDIDGRYIFNEVSKGNKIYIDLVDRWIEEILIGLTSIIHFYNPSLIVFGGGVMQQDYIINKLQENLKNYVMPSFDKVLLRKAELLNKAGIYGASIIAKEM